MKFASFEKDGAASWGAVVDGGVCDLKARLDGKYADLKAVIAADALSEAAAAAAGQPADASLDAVRLLPVIGNPDKILMVGLNYHSHREETGRSETDHPTIFVRFPDSQVGHGEAMLVPKVSSRLDYEGELAVIIGKGGRSIPEASALDHIAAYSCYNDGSVRDWQRHTTQWTPGKNFVATGAFGPWMVTADEIPDPTALSLITRLNGEEMQRTTTDLMIFPVIELIAYCSTFCNLVPGDLIISGTPSGVGFARDPQVFMKPGDKVEIEISGIGTLENPIAAA